MSMPVSRMRESEFPVEPLAEPEHWSLPAEMDPELLVIHARRERDRAVADVLRKIGRGVRMAVAEGGRGTVCALARARAHDARAFLPRRA